MLSINDVTQASKTWLLRTVTALSQSTVFDITVDGINLGRLVNKQLGWEKEEVYYNRV